MKIKRLIEKFSCKDKRKIGKEFRKFIESKKDEFDDFSLLEKKIASLNEFLRNVEDFIAKKRLELNSSVDIDEVVGTDHLKYIGYTYLEMLDFGLKMDINIPLFLQNPEYYYDKNRKNPAIYYACFNLPGGDKIAFVDGDGNHRTAIAKVIRAYDKSYTTIYGVVKTTYYIDYEMMNKFLYLKEETEKSGYTLQINKIEASVKEDKNGEWIEWKYKHTFELYGKGKSEEYSSLSEIDLISLMPFYKRILYKLKVIK